MIKIYNSQQAYDNASEPYDDCDEDGVTQEHKQTLIEYDEDITKLEQQLKSLLERRREYINRNELNEKVGVQ